MPEHTRHDGRAWAIAVTVMFGMAVVGYVYLATQESRTEIAVAEAFGSNPCASLLLMGLAEKLQNETRDGGYGIYRECLNETAEAYRAE